MGAQTTMGIFQRKQFTVFVLIVISFITSSPHLAVQRSIVIQNKSSSEPPVLIPQQVTVTNLVKEALDSNPELAVMRHEFDASRARIPQAKALSDPTLTFGNNTQANPLPFAGVKGDFSETFLGVSQDVPWFGIRRLRGQITSAETEAKLQSYEAAVRKLTAEVKTAYYDLYLTDRTLAVIKRDIEILDKFAQIAEARYTVGKAQQVDVINARVEIAELLNQQGALEAKRTGTVAQINSFLFRSLETPINFLSEIQINLNPPPSFEELIKLAEENAPDIKQQRRLIEASNHAIRLAEREAKYPEVGFNFTYHNRPVFPDYYTYGITLRLPFYAHTKQRYVIEEKTADLAAARARLASTESMIRYRLRSAYIRATTTSQRFKLHKEGILPQATLALESSMTAYEVGKVDFLTLLTALKRALDYEMHYYELLTDYQKALAEMEIFIGIELTK